jgi:hypothetical protein
MMSAPTAAVVEPCTPAPIDATATDTLAPTHLAVHHRVQSTAGHDHQNQLTVLHTELEAETAASDVIERRI